MAKVNIYEFTVKEEVKEIDGSISNIAKFAGETKEEAEKYVKMAGFTIIEFVGIKEESKKPVYTLPDLYTYRETNGQSHAI